MNLSVPDWRLIGRLAWPLILSGAIEAPFSLTHTSIVTCLSTDVLVALAPIASLDY